MEASPELDHNQLAGAVGQVIDGDQELSQLSQANPHLAVRLATRVAQADLDAKRQAASHKNRSRQQAAPVAARNGTVVGSQAPASLEDAFRLALKQQGATPDF